MIGVASRQSDYPLETQIWFPFISSDAEKDPVDNWEYEAIARLAPGVSLDEIRKKTEASFKVGKGLQ